MLHDIKAAEGMAAEEQRTPALCAARTRLHGLLRPRHDALLAQFVQFVRNPATREILMAGGSADGDGGSADCSGGDSAHGRRRHDPAALMAAAGGGSSNGGGGGGGGGNFRPGTAPPAVQEAVQEAPQEAATVQGKQAAAQGKQAPAASGAFRSLAVAAVRQKAAVAAPEANFFQIARRQLQDEGGFEAFRAELKPLLIRLKALSLALTLALTPALALALALNLNLSLTRTLTHQEARHRVEMHLALDAVHSVFVRLALGGLCEEFAVYVPAEGRDYWRTLASTSVDGTTGCMERPVSRKENATHQLGYQP